MSSAVSKFELHFDKADLVFRDGEYITGYMEVNLISEIKYKSIYFELRGMTIISWNHDSSNADVTDASNVDDDTGSFLDKDPILTVGEHVFPFDLKVPCDLPYSFEGRYGKVKYDCVGIIEKSSSGFKMSEKMTSKRQDISIMSGLDLNLIPEASASFILLCYFFTFISVSIHDAIFYLSLLEYL
ncbi:hypothetical protein HELRODRAFT_163310 [Helobdella robusta]|uniref:Arrestin-like N-terminal domain-containing protein n=1 Tax=Helobdella robusta TaxID=6412 RepID=T1ETW3_HELRO|nr:hypothetical protein HELRODRAFT_163310 [Helobdella robusta]ESN96263.1 hypothetical protein HELRODRAFT_163310 [Helobdella robusta]